MIGETELCELAEHCKRKIGHEPLTPIGHEHEVVLKLIAELREKRKHDEEYKWHDLRINPRDLPRRGILVEVKFETGNYNHAIYDWDDECFGFRNVSRADLRSSVIAWRHIEPIEEDYLA